MRMRSNRKGWQRRRGHHPLDKKRPFNDERFFPMRDALKESAGGNADEMLAEYQAKTTRRGHVYSCAMAMVNVVHSRGEKRNSLHSLLTLAHHQCFNLPAI